LASLTADVRQSLTPIFELTPIPLAFPSDVKQPGYPSKSIDDHAAWIIDRIKKSSAPGTVLVDGFQLEDYELADGREVISLVLAELSAASFAPIPVVGTERESGYVDAVKEFMLAGENDACLRLTAYDYRKGLRERVGRILDSTGAAPDHVHLLIDFAGVAQAHVEPLKSAIIPNINSVADIANWKSVLFAASGFPPALSDIGQYEMDSFARTEWDLWTHAVERKNELARLPTFSDYCTSNPELQEFDPRKMSIAPKLKYTGGDSWLVAKGKAPKRLKSLKAGEKNTPNSDQLKVLAEMIMKSKEWKSPDFSGGDRQIAKYAGGEGPHDATTCVVAGVAHHLTYVVKQIASLAGV
jgi:hypothetical protein